MTFVDLQAHKIAESVVKSADNHSSSYQKFLLQKKKKTRGGTWKTILLPNIVNEPRSQ